MVKDIDKKNSSERITLIIVKQLHGHHDIICTGREGAGGREGGREGERARERERVESKARQGIQRRQCTAGTALGGTQ